MIKKRSRRGKLTMPEISLTPLIDTALTLLIIFMVTTPMMNNSIKVTLPKGQAKESSDSPQDLIVYVDKQSKIYFEDKQVNFEQLIPAIKKSIGTNKNKTIFVKADELVHYGKIISIVDHIKVVGGVEYVALATQSPKAA